MLEKITHQFWRKLQRKQNRNFIILDSFLVKILRRTFQSRTYYISELISTPLSILFKMNVKKVSWKPTTFITCSKMRETHQKEEIQVSNNFLILARLSRQIKFYHVKKKNKPKSTKKWKKYWKVKKKSTSWPL